MCGHRPVRCPHPRSGRFGAGHTGRSQTMNPITAEELAVLTRHDPHASPEYAQTPSLPVLAPVHDNRPRSRQYGARHPHTEHVAAMKVLLVAPPGIHSDGLRSGCRAWQRTARSSTPPTPALRSTTRQCTHRRAWSWWTSMRDRTRCTRSSARSWTRSRAFRSLPSPLLRTTRPSTPPSTPGHSDTSPPATPGR